VKDRIDEWRLGFHDTWGGWKPGTGAEIADRLAAELADGTEAQARAREGIEAVDSRYDPTSSVMYASAVWVPHRETGQVYAFMEMELLVGSMSPEEYLARNRRPPRDRSIKLFHHDIAPGEVNAGPAVIGTRSFADKKTKSVWTSIHWTVFPPGAVEALELSFATQVAAYAQTMSDESVKLVNSLSVTLGSAT